MKKIIDLKTERSEIIAKMEVIAENESLTEEIRSEWDGHDSRVKAIDEEIALLERQEELNKTNVKKMEETTEIRKDEQPLAIQFRDWLKDAVDGKAPLSFRADPILTSTQAGIINKTVANSVDILTSPGEAFLRQLGVTFYPGLVGNFVIPAMAEDTAEFVNEAGDASTSSMSHDALTLAARRVSAFQGITRETLAQTNPAIYTSILQNLVNGVWKAVTNDVFDTLETDASTQIGAFGGGPVTYADLVQMEASIGGLNIGAGAYVTTPSVKAYLKKTAVLGTDNGPIWGNDNMVNGYPAYGVPAANTDKIYFGDFSRVAVGQWGGLEIIVDPYTKAKQGEIVITAVGLYDTGCFNKRAFAIMNDASVV